jgi:hypothetical protein
MEVLGYDPDHTEVDSCQDWVLRVLYGYFSSRFER